MPRPDQDDSKYEPEGPKSDDDRDSDRYDEEEDEDAEPERVHRITDEDDEEELAEADILEEFGEGPDA
jgi:hypothetical protein